MEKKVKYVPRAPLYPFSSPRGLEDDGKRNYAGVYVSNIDEGSPADNAGIKPGDLLSGKLRKGLSAPETPTIIYSSITVIESERHFKSMTRLLPINQKLTFHLRRYVLTPVEKSEATHVIRVGRAHLVELQPKVLQWHYTPPGWGIILKQPSREESRKYKYRGVIVKSITPESALGTTLRPGDLIYKIVSKEVEIVDKKKKPLVEFEIHSLEVFTMNLPMLTPGKQFWFHFEQNNKSTSELVTIPKD